MGLATSTATLAREAPSFGSLATMGRAKPKKKPVLVLDPEELEQAHLLFQQDAAEQLGEFEPIERERGAGSLFGLAPMGEDDDVYNDMSPADRAAKTQISSPLDGADPVEDLEEEADAPEPDKVLSMTRPASRKADSAMPFGAMPLPPVPTAKPAAMPAAPQGLPEQDQEDPSVAPAPLPIAAEDTSDYSAITPGFSARGLTPASMPEAGYDEPDEAEGEPENEPMSLGLSRLINAPVLSEDSQADIDQGEFGKDDIGQDDTAALSSDWDDFNEVEASANPPLSGFDNAPDAAKNDSAATPTPVSFDDWDVSGSDEGWATPPAKDAAEPETAASRVDAPAPNELTQDDLNQDDLGGDFAPLENHADHAEFEHPPHEDIDHQIESVTVFDDEIADATPAEMPAFAPQDGTQNALRARLVREDVCLARPELSLWGKCFARLRRIWWALTVK